MTVLARPPGQRTEGTVVPAGGPLIGQEYFWIYDQTGQLWAWWISYDLAADWRFEPEHDFDQEVRFYIVPWWLKMGDSDGVAWWVYPAADGSPLVHITQPPLGEGITLSPALRVRGGTARYQYAVVGGDLDILAA